MKSWKPLEDQPRDLRTEGPQDLRETGPVGWGWGQPSGLAFTLVLRDTLSKTLQLLFKKLDEISLTELQDLGKKADLRKSETISTVNASSKKSNQKLLEKYDKKLYMCVCVYIYTYT